MKTFFEWIECLYRERFTGKIELDFLNGIPRSWSKQGPRESFKIGNSPEREQSARVQSAMT